ncbi:alpha/beta hydrolase [Lentiprolixibacter aurantiacus]|uniref:Alpha/beta hydrolase n=1 Tax=Lentiprolixibacter aurantiacus TaxID=2993939 RepID=A0AAE3MMA6_9FLAO|nr:alpha/beta hydrolase [Lentiprolixibacter aurantiacus]MCX2720460.1 alpha/beta hydrolase [Lentiprolixibacter aurantiacus]
MAYPKGTYLFALLIFFTAPCSAQEIIELPHKDSGNIEWADAPKEYYSKIWNTQVLTNVSRPTLEVFRPAGTPPNGTGIIVAPGGGLYALSVNKEGKDVARWLNQKGITVFVLNYRLVPSGEDGVKELLDGGEKNADKIARVLPLSIADGLTAVSYVREHAGELGVNPDKIGFMGFSAGGSVTMGVAFNANKSNMPDFLVPVYPWMTIMGEYKVPEEAPPMAVVCASDDPLLLARESVELYSEWLDSGISTELHLYAKGGHGFGMLKQNLPSDTWLARVYEWAVAEGLVVTPTKY